MVVIAACYTVHSSMLMSSVDTSPPVKIASKRYRFVRYFQLIRLRVPLAHGRRPLSRFDECDPFPASKETFSAIVSRGNACAFFKICVLHLPAANSCINPGGRGWGGPSCAVRGPPMGSRSPLQLLVWTLFDLHFSADTFRNIPSPLSGVPALAACFSGFLRERRGTWR